MRQALRSAGRHSRLVSTFLQAQAEAVTAKAVTPAEQGASFLVCQRSCGQPVSGRCSRAFAAGTWSITARHRDDAGTRPCEALRKVCGLDKGVSGSPLARRGSRLTTAHHVAGGKDSGLAILSTRKQVAAPVRRFQADL